MSKRESVFVSEDEVIRQREYMSLIRDNSSGKVKNYSISTFGCQMNENDSERLSGMLSEMGYVFTENEEESDLIIYNTCCVRENAELKVYGHLGKLKNLKKNNPDLIIAVCGCMMQQEEVVEHIKSKFRHVNLVFGTHNLYKFPELLFNVVNSGERIYQIWDSVGEIAEGVPIDRKDGVKAWVTVMYGCNNFCSYCIVPYVRGRERSRRLEDIANEVKMLGRQGYREVTLLGQNVNSYGKDMENATNFASLLREVNMIEEIERIRFMTSHPKDLSDELIQAMRDCEKVCEHLHLPIQSGSTRVLRDMNRKYTKEQYLELVNKIRSNIPNLSITTDIIVGYPGETDEDFEETLDVIKKVRYDTAYTFLYSPRKGTPAEKNLNQVPDDIKKVRFDKLLEVQNAISKEINDTLIGSEMEVLVEGPSRNRLETYTGRTRTNKIVNFKGDKELTGKLVRVNIDRAQTWSLEGTII